jgi:hypothetical protein
VVGLSRYWCPESLNTRYKPLRLHTCVDRRELPLGYDVILVSTCLPRGKYRSGTLAEDAPIKTLRRQDWFGFRHFQSTAVFGRIVPAEPFDKVGCPSP